MLKYDYVRLRKVPKVEEELEGLITRSRTTEANEQRINECNLNPKSISQRIAAGRAQRPLANATEA